MFENIIICAFFTLLYAIKGGSGKTLFPWWKKLRETNAFTERLLDGKVISTIGAFLFGLVYTAHMVTPDGGAFGVPEYDLDVMAAAKFALIGWLAAVAPSMGEENGAIGRVGHAWGEYLEWMPKVKDIDFFGQTLFSYSEGRMYGIKKGVQRGVWMGAMMAFALGSTVFIPYSLLYVPCVFIGQELYYRLTGKDSWVLTEPLIGLFVFGLPIALHG